MRTEKYSARAVVELLRRQRVASLEDVRACLGGASRRTACRKLAAAGCRSSYSHCGRYYTLDELAEYDERGLWFCRGVRFSQAGTLLSTAQALVEQAPCGRFAEELRTELQVETQDALRRLFAAGRLTRERLDGRFLYLSRDSGRRRRQLRARKATGATGVEKRVADERVRSATGTLFGLLDEQERRLFAGLESLRYGHGGDLHASRRLGVHPATVAKGRKQLLSGDVQADRVRKRGGGRKSSEKKTPNSNP